VDEKTGDVIDLDDAITEALGPVASLCAKKDLTRADLHTLLDACIDLADAGLFHTEACAAVEAGADEADTEQAWVKGQAACDIGQIINFALFSRTAESWTKGRYQDPSEMSECQRQTVRASMATLIQCVPSALPYDLRGMLSGALQALNYGDGRLPDLFKPAPKVGRGNDPWAIRSMEEGMCTWIAYQASKGMKSEAAKAKVAALTGVTVKAVEKWRESWITRDGAEFVKRYIEREIAEEGRLLAPLPDMVADWKRAKGFPK
jgi:hypothetical protein